jgi:hypothetical protein
MAVHSVNCSDSLLAVRCFHMSSAARRWQRRASTWGASSCTPTSRHRDGPEYDLMELYSPAVDAPVLALLASTTFTCDDVVQGRAGECRCIHT